MAKLGRFFFKILPFNLLLPDISHYITLTNSDWTKYSMQSWGKRNHRELWTVRGDGVGAISDF